MLQSIVPESGKMINVTIKGDIPRIKGDADQIVEVFHNYLIMLLNTQMMGVQ